MTYAPRPYKIISIKKLTEDVKVFRIKCNLNPKPGRFLEITFPGIGECPLTSCSYDKNYLDFLVRNAGNVTSKMFQAKKGDALFIRGPYGKGFPLEKIKGKNIIIIGGGTGIAPITSLIEYIQKNRKNFGGVKIYMGFRDENNVLLKNKIKEWKKDFEVTISLNEPVVSGKIKCERGFIHEIIKKCNPETKNTLAFICGPELMMECATKELNSCDLPNNKIYWSMERRMECAMGNCGRCLIQDLYVCKDGPVFRYDIIKPKIENENSSNQIKGD